LENVLTQRKEIEDAKRHADIVDSVKEQEEREKLQDAKRKELELFEKTQNVLLVADIEKNNLDLKRVKLSRK
jgi:uncharacterized phage-like protein YoqJ